MRPPRVYVDGLMQAASQPRGEALEALLSHAGSHMSDRAVRDDWDCVLPLARTPEDYDALVRYRKLRMRAPGFRGDDWHANNHERIAPDWLTVPGRPSTSCATCGKGFTPRRRTARFCTSDCRVRNHRRPSAVTLGGSQ